MISACSPRPVSKTHPGASSDHWDEAGMCPGRTPEHQRVISPACAATTPDTQIIACATVIRSCCVAFHRQHVLYTSNVNTEDVVINSGLGQEVHAMNRLIRRATVLIFPETAIDGADTARLSRSRDYHATAANQPRPRDQAPTRESGSDVTSRDDA